VHKLLGPDTVRFSGDALGAFHVHRVKGLCATFGIETDRIHRSMRVRQRIGHRLSVPDIGSNGSQSRIIGSEQRSALIRMSRRNPHNTPARMQGANNAPAEETGSAENSDDA
jgi:hypothetical protein